MIDSVFSPLLEIPFPDDAPLIPATEITRGLDSVEAPASEIMARLQRDAVEVLLRKAGPFLSDRNLAGIQSLTWNLGVTLQSPIYSVWSLGFELGSGHMLREMKAALPKGRFATTQEAVAALLVATPATITNTPAQAAVARRALTLAGNFSDDQLTAIKGHLQAAIVPVDGKLLSRPELLQKIEGSLSVGKTRAETIARTELTNAYNSGRVQTALQSSLVTHLRFLAISDARTTPICRGRNGMLIPVTDRGAIGANSPSLHVRCRSVLSPVMAGLNPTHAKWASDPGRDYQARDLAPLPKGWRTGTLPDPPPSTPVPTTKPPAKTKKPKAKTGSPPNTEALTSPKALIVHGRSLVDTSKLDAVISEGKTEIARLKNAAEAIAESISTLDESARQKAFEAYGLAEQAVSDYEKKYNGLLRAEASKIKQSILDSGMGKKEASKLAQKIKIDLPSPEDRKIVRDAVTQNLMLTGGKGSSVKALGVAENRGYADKVKKYINMGDVSGETILHEMGHFVEFESEEIRKAANDFIYGRATGAPQKLSKLTNVNYEDNQIALPDKFINPYVGRVYASGDTEVVSMGLEMLYSDRTLAEFYEKDPEHFFFTIGAIRR